VFERVARSFLLWLGAAGMQVMSVGWDMASAWSWQEWAKRLLFAAILGAAGLLAAGQKNPTLQR
jgi:hypothetical protein